MRESWIKFGCFLTGYNYSILRNCSEIAKKSVKRFTAALIIMCVLWGLIGYSFANRYLHSSLWTSIATAIVFIVIIIQVERQIILQTHKNNYLHIFRGVIAVMMALIGSLIVDQLIFKDDIELEKEQFINSKIERIYPAEAKNRQGQIDDLKKQLLDKNDQRGLLQKDIQTSPTIPITIIQSTPMPVQISTTDSNGRTNSRTKYTKQQSTTTNQIPNPSIELLAPLDSQINAVQRLILAQGDSLGNLRGSIQKRLMAKTGFLDELNIMFHLLAGSTPAMVVYIIWFVLLLGLEFFILMTKRHDQTTDYDAMINHQMAFHIRKLNILSGNGMVVKDTEGFSRERK